MSKIWIILGAIVAMAAIGAGLSTITQENIKVQKFSTADDGLAMGGFDPVTYFEGGPKIGSEIHVFEWHGAKFRFIDQDNLTRFSGNPESYAPQFGGYCSFGMNFAKPAIADPEAFVVQDGKLYLNASPMVKRFWGWFGNPEKAEVNWKELRTNSELK